MIAFEVAVPKLGTFRTRLLCSVLMSTLISCSSAKINLESQAPSPSQVAIRYLRDGLGEGQNSIASSQDGYLYVLEPGAWRIKIFPESETKTAEVDLDPGRYLMAGGAIQGMAIYDATKGILMRYDQQGSRVISAGFKDRQVDALWLTSSGEYLFLDGTAGRVMIHEQGLREIRSWNLKGQGRPQAIAGNPLEGLVAVAYPDEKRIDTYSLLGMLLDRRSFPVQYGAQAIACDRSGRLWAIGTGDSIFVFQFSKRGWQEKGACHLPGVRAISPAPKEGIVALVRGSILHLFLP